MRYRNLILFGLIFALLLSACGGSNSTPSLLRLVIQAIQAKGSVS